MPYKLRKAPNKELYWVITIETGKKHSKLPISLDKAKAQMRILESALHGGVLGIVGQATSYMIDDYKEAMKSNPRLPPIEELDKFLNPNDLLWMKSVLDTYKTWDKYLTKAKDTLELDFPDNLQEFLKKRNAFTNNMPKFKYYLKHISRLLPPISQEKTLVEQTAEAHARGELDEMPKPAVKKSEPPPVAPKKPVYSHPLYAINKVQLPPVHVPKPGVEGPLAKQILKKLIEKGAPEERARQNATYLDLVRRGLGALHGGATAVQLRSIKKSVDRLFPTLNAKYTLNPTTGKITCSVDPCENEFGLFDAAFKGWLSPAEYTQLLKTQEYRNFKEFLQAPNIYDSFRVAEEIAHPANFRDLNDFDEILSDLYEQLKLKPPGSEERKLLESKFVKTFQSFRQKMFNIAWDRLEEVLIGPGVQKVDMPGGDYTYVSNPPPRKEFPPYPAKKGRGKKCLKCGKLKV